MKAVITLSRNTDGKVLKRLSDRAVMALVRRHGAKVDPFLVEEGWVDRDELEALGWVEVEPVTPMPGEKVLVPNRLGWTLVEVA